MQIDMIKILGESDAESQKGKDRVGNGIARILRGLGLGRTLVLGTTFLGLVGAVCLLPFTLKKW